MKQAVTSKAIVLYSKLFPVCVTQEYCPKSPLSWQLLILSLVVNDEWNKQKYLPVTLIPPRWPMKSSPMEGKALKPSRQALN